VSFLYPWLWLGAAAVGAPLWLHLRHKRSRDVVGFAAVRFLMNEPRPRHEPWRLRDLLLLAVRVAALLLLIAAFAWPYRRDRGAVAVTESRVHLLDNSLSQQAGGAFERDRERVLAALRAAGPQVQDAVVELTSEPRVIGGFGDDRQALQAKVAALQPSYERGSYLEAFRLASSLLAQSLGDAHRLVVYGDGQENQWTENETTAPFLRGIDVSLASRPEVETRPNVWVADPTVQRTFLGDASFVDLSVLLSRQGPARSALVTLRADGREVLSRRVELPPGQGSVLLDARWPSDPSVWVQGEIAVEAHPDVLAADNVAYFALPPVLEGQVGFLARSPYLRTALAPEVMKGRWAARELEPWGRGTEAEPLSDVLVVEASYLQSQQVRDLILRHLNDGRGVVLTLERATPLVTAFLRPLGFTLREAEGGAAAEQPFRYMATEHPIFRPFRSPDFGSLADVRVRPPLRVQAEGARPLLFAENGDALLFEATRTKGRLLVFAFGFTRDETNWPVDPTFVPFLDLCLQHARGGAVAEVTFRPGELHIVDVPAESHAREVVLRAGTAVVARAPVESGHARLRLPRRPGLYTLGYDADPTPRDVLGINPSPRESQLRYVAEPAALKAWQLPGVAPEVARPVEPADLAAARDQRLWWWCLLAAAALLAVEIGWLGRRRVIMG
jgi:hypothetical protein